MNCPRCSYRVSSIQTVCENCGASLAPSPVPGYTPATMQRPTSVGGLSKATAIVLGLVGLCYLADAIIRITRVGSTVTSALSVLTLVLNVVSVIVLVPLFLVWFFLIRRNAGLWGPQRRSQGWSIGAWFVPIVFLWFPFQIADDAWRASLPQSAERRGSSLLVIGWWVCWLLAWFTGFYSTQTTGTGAGGTTFVTNSVGFSLGSTLVSVGFAAAAALLGALMVWSLGRMQQARLTGTDVTPAGQS